MSPLQRSDFHSRNSRRKILQDEFGFFCNCNLCSLADADLFENDVKRRELLDIEHQWVNLGQDPQKALDLAEKQLKLGKNLQLQPGLLAYISLHCVEASSLVISMEDDDQVLKQGLQYAQIAKSYGEMAYGSGSDEAKVFASICSQWNSTPPKDLFTIVQDCIAELRDI